MEAYHGESKKHEFHALTGVIGNVTYSRGSMGVQLERTEHCNVCRRPSEALKMRVNIDGVWHYMCNACALDLADMLLKGANHHD